MAIAQFYGKILRIVLDCVPHFMGGNPQRSDTRAVINTLGKAYDFSFGIKVIGKLRAGRRLNTDT